MWADDRRARRTARGISAACRALAGDTKWRAVICREADPDSPGGGEGWRDARLACPLEYPRRRRPTCAHPQNACQAPCGCPEERRRPQRGPLDVLQRRTLSSGASSRRSTSVTR